MNEKIFGPTKVGVVGPAPPALFLEQSQKHVWNGAYDHFNCLETRLYLRCNKLQLSDSHVGCIITGLTIK